MKALYKASIRTFFGERRPLELREYGDKFWWYSRCETGRWNSTTVYGNTVSEALDKAVEAFADDDYRREPCEEEATQ